MNIAYKCKSLEERNYVLNKLMEYGWTPEEFYNDEKDFEEYPYVNLDNNFDDGIEIYAVSERTFHYWDDIEIVNNMEDILIKKEII